MSGIKTLVGWCYRNLSDQDFSALIKKHAAEAEITALKKILAGIENEIDDMYSKLDAGAQQTALEQLEIQEQHSTTSRNRGLLTHLKLAHFVAINSNGLSEETSSSAIKANSP